MSRWRYAPFHELDVLTLSAPKTLDASPAMRYLELIVEEILASNGALKATTKGNLPAKLVKKASALLPAFAVAASIGNLSIREFSGNNEDKFNAPHYTRVLAELAGIIRKRKGHFVLGAAVKKTYEKSRRIFAVFYPAFEPGNQL